MESGEIIRLQNDHLSVGVKYKGAELSSLKKKGNSEEYIWQADPIFWGRHSCILFPIIGKLKKGQYQLGEQTYFLGQHGFARDKRFDIYAKDDHELAMILRSNADSLTYYPFPFELHVVYTIHEYTLDIDYKVVNTGDRPMPFSLGAHPAFNCPLGSLGSRKDYSLLFAQNEVAYSRCLDDDGLINDDVRLILNNSDTLPISDGLFDQDALIFQDLRSDEVSLLDPQGNKLWTFRFKEFPYLGIWSQKGNAPFVCIEPWFGIADSCESDRDLFHKEGILVLDEAKAFSCRHSITLH